MNKEEMAREGHEALRDFFDQFGPNDVYKEIFLLELFRFLYEEMYGHPPEE
jgi:hypothetical protein